MWLSLCLSLLCFVGILLSILAIWLGWKINDKVEKKFIFCLVYFIYALIVFIVIYKKG